MEPLGLIAGEGLFPVLVARGARAIGRPVICTAFSGIASPELARECDDFTWVSLFRPNKWIRVLRGAGCSEAIMVGRVSHTRAYDPFRYFRYIPDLRAVRMMWRILRDKRPQTILSMIADELASTGLQLIDSTTYCQDQLASAGVMTRMQPTEVQWSDIRLGWPMAQQISRMDIGQSIAVREGTVMAVEAIEGTNAMIERAGLLCKTGKWTLIKVSNAKQDMRLDVPTIGTTTIEKLHAAGAACCALEPGKTIILEKPKVLELADKYKIALVGYEPPVT